MSDELPIAQVPESTWLRVLANALDPETEAADESLVPQDDTDPQDDTVATGGDEALGAGDDPGGWGESVDVDDMAVADGEAAVDTYTAALPEELDDRDVPDDAGW